MKPRVLVIDDEQVVLDSVQRALRRDELEVEGELDSTRALERLASEEYQLVITDLMMPGLDGLQLLARLSDQGRQLPVIMITGYPTIRTAMQAKRLGAFEYVTKPFTRDELRSVVLRALQVGSRPEETAPGVGQSEQGADFLVLPGHCWTRPVADDSAGDWLMGAEPEFVASIGRVEGLDLPEPGALLEQGRPALKITVADGVAHSLHAPLTGSVVETNPQLDGDPELIRRQPRGAGWLLRFRPLELERERDELVPD